MEDTTGARIREARKAQGMEQKELADLLDVKQQMVSSWELTGRVARKHWPKLAEVLGVELSAVGPYSGNTNTHGVAVSHSPHTTIGAQDAAHMVSMTFSARQKTPRKISYLRGVSVFVTV